MLVYKTKAVTEGQGDHCLLPDVPLCSIVNSVKPAYDTWWLCILSGCVVGLEWSACFGQNHNILVHIPSATEDLPISTVFLLTLTIPEHCTILHYRLQRLC